MANRGVRLDKNPSIDGNALLRDDVTRLSSAAERPTTRTVATMPAPRHMLPSEGPVARWTAAVVTSIAEGWDDSCLPVNRP